MFHTSRRPRWCSQEFIEIIAEKCHIKPQTVKQDYLSKNAVLMPLHVKDLIYFLEDKDSELAGEVRDSAIARDTLWIIHQNIGRALSLPPDRFKEGKVPRDLIRGPREQIGIDKECVKEVENIFNNYIFLKDLIRRGTYITAVEYRTESISKHQRKTQEKKEEIMHLNKYSPTLLTFGKDAPFKKSKSIKRIIEERLDRIIFELEYFSEGFVDKMIKFSENLGLGGIKGTSYTFVINYLLRYSLPFVFPHISVSVKGRCSINMKYVLDSILKNTKPTKPIITYAFSKLEIEEEEPPLWKKINVMLSKVDKSLPMITSSTLKITAIQYVIYDTITDEIAKLIDSMISRTLKTVEKFVSCEHLLLNDLSSKDIQLLRFYNICREGLTIKGNVEASCETTGYVCSGRKITFSITSPISLENIINKQEKRSLKDILISYIQDTLKDKPDKMFSKDSIPPTDIFSLLPITLALVLEGYTSIYNKVNDTKKKTKKKKLIDVLREDVINIATIPKTIKNSLNIPLLFEYTPEKVNETFKSIICHYYNKYGINSDLGIELYETILRLRDNKKLNEVIEKYYQ